MAYLNDWRERFKLGHASASPFQQIGRDYCPHCRMDVECRMEAHHQRTTYAFKRWCKRCGRVVSRGVYDNVVMVTGEPLSQKAVDWTQEREALTK